MKLRFAHGISLTNKWIGVASINHDSTAPQLKCTFPKTPTYLCNQSAYKEGVGSEADQDDIFIRQHTAVQCSSLAEHA